MRTTYSALAVLVAIAFSSGSALADEPAATAARVTTRSGEVADAIAFQRALVADLDKRLEGVRKRSRPSEPDRADSGTESESTSADRSQSEEALQSLQSQREAALSTIDVLSNESVSPDDAKKALAIQQDYLRQAGDARDEDAVRALKTSTAALRAVAQAGAVTVPVVSAEKQEDIEFRRGEKLRYGPTISLLRFSVARDRAEPARYRNYEPQLEFIPAEFGFAFVYQPSNPPWRIKRKGDGTFQLMSVGGMLLASIDKNDVSRGSVSLAATLGFFQDVVGLGIGLDLYRGIETAGPGGAVGKETAYTGLLAWSLSPRGEVTPENVFFVVTLGLVPLVNSITGELK